jgi:uncharacterized protein YecE (DUF72 family)
MLYGSPDQPENPVAACLPDDDVVELGKQMPAGLRLGTSSWAFAGWRGLVYGDGAKEKQLSRYGLAAYSSHPLLGTVGVDRTFYSPIPAATFAEYAAQVPAGFRFLVKAFRDLLSPWVRGQRGGNPRYLHVDTAVERVIAPAVEGLADRLGPLLFQLPPQGKGVTRRPAEFAERLGGFLAALPRGVDYAVELRDEELLTDDYAAALTAASVRHCYCVHPTMPSIKRQVAVVPPGGSVTVRWMLQPGNEYDEAKERYAPFDRLVASDPVRRAEIAELCDESLLQGVPVTVVINNKAEGSAPMSVIELARELRRRARERESRS